MRCAVSTLIYFNRKYYKYNGGEKEEQELAIGGYELAFLADLVASHIFDKSRTLLNPTTHHVFYQDDGLVVLKGNKIVQEIKYWLEKFQKAMDKAAVNQHLQFIAEIWTNDTNPPIFVKE